MAQKKKTTRRPAKPKKRSASPAPRKSAAAASARPISAPPSAKHAQAFRALRGSDPFVVILQIRGELYRIPFGSLVDFRAFDLDANAAVRAFLDSLEQTRGIDKAILIGSEPAASEGG